jgi:hypothetical protein
MKVSPKTDYPVQVIREPEEHDGPEAALYAGIYLVLLNHEMPVYFVPDVSRLAPPWDGGVVSDGARSAATVEQARLSTVTFARYAVTPNPGRAAAVERFSVPRSSGDTVSGVVFYVTPEEFDGYLADLEELSEVVWEPQPDKTVSQLREYAVIRFLEERVVASDRLEPRHAVLLGRGGVVA